MYTQHLGTMMIAFLLKAEIQLKEIILLFIHMCERERTSRIKSEGKLGSLNRLSATVI